jgi:GNAT superfamily N-acetyltransferase
MSGNENEMIKRKCEPDKKEEKTLKSKEEKELSEEGTCQVQANKSIYFKIIYDEKEFDSFQNMNFENTFQPTYTYELFANEKIHGYKGLKILISLTPKTFFAHVKIIYSQKLAINGNLEEVFANHYKSRYTTDKNIFLSQLSKENDIISPKGKLIYEEGLRKIYNIDILNDDFTAESYSLQAMCTVFIDAASFIPLETNFWGYFLITEIYDEKDKDKKWRTIGFCSYKNFHIELDKYYTMLSQFLIIPTYQRRGVGTFLLEHIYKYLFNEDKCCLEITTEDPDIGFILMRDYTICKIIVNEKCIDNLLKLFGGIVIEKKETYDQFNLIKSQVDCICKKLKLQDNLINRAFEIIKYGLVANTKELLTLFEKDKKSNMKKMIDESSFENIKLKRNRGPFIFFHDEVDYDYKKNYQENSTISSEKKVEMLYPEYIADIEKVVPKINGMIFDYKSKLN